MTIVIQKAQVLTRSQERFRHGKDCQVDPLLNPAQLSFSIGTDPHYERELLFLWCLNFFVISLVGAVWTAGSEQAGIRNDHAIQQQYVATRQRRADIMTQFSLPQRGNQPKACHSLRNHLLFLHMSSNVSKYEMKWDSIASLSIRSCKPSVSIMIHFNNILRFSSGEINFMICLLLTLS